MHSAYSTREPFSRAINIQETDLEHPLKHIRTTLLAYFSHFRTCELRTLQQHDIDGEYTAFPEGEHCRNTIYVILRNIAIGFDAVVIADENQALQQKYFSTEPAESDLRGQPIKQAASPYPQGKLKPESHRALRYTLLQYNNKNEAFHSFASGTEKNEGD